MDKAPKALRLQIGIFGRTNVGKSSFLNLISSQDVAITSPMPGTTTDVVEKTMELLPVGPVVFLDTAGVDDESDLGELRIQKTQKIFDRSDVFVLLVEPNVWTEYEAQIVKESTDRKTPIIIVINKIDTQEASKEFIENIKSVTERFMPCSSVDVDNREQYVNQFKQDLIQVCPDGFLNPPTLIGDLVPSGGLAILIVPIDLQAPKGRLILPQVQTIRDALDNDATVMVVKEREYRHALENLKNPPDIVICDSQVVQKMVADTPSNIKSTTFSILFSRYKGDLMEQVRGAAAIDRLQPNDKILIAEACSHHSMEDDIGRVKIPRWIRQYVGFDIQVDSCAGRDYPENLNDYKLIIHCGGCMITRREMLFRLHHAKNANVPITNYGVCISVLQGVLKKALEPFPAALDAYVRELVKGR